ncbi:sugar phosphate nucleotidyltransferase [Paenibacillus sp. KQZ6P-2]|uniref:Sugar phosphate nucleotidyltransferase n=1 Tax=Paenibacillus mangrovi TaxID=2931978 RepID=A0A9X1WRD9_9BACL|nr:sugar phosphate nucleotidyltransferase [Paenibacillus mangrovi]MCJ8013887.1 sugar phosphate nucleotidyltransferase [Paenibacillus mangrovi]
MKGIILCAGQGTRLRPYTHSIPKTLIPVLNKPILLRCIESLLESGITDIGVVIRPDQKIIVDYIESIQDTVKVTVLYQMEARGIAHALLSAKKFLGEDSFIVLLGDNLFTIRIDKLQQIFAANDGAVLLTPVSNPQDFGIAEVSNQHIVKLEEKPAHPKSNLAVIGMYAFNNKIFDAIEQITPSRRGEYEITDAIQQMISNGCRIASRVTKLPFYDIGTPDRWLDANKSLLSRQANQIGSNNIFENCTLKGSVVIGDGCTFKNVSIGPNVTIGNNCTIHNGTLSDSISLDNTYLNFSGLHVKSSIFGRNTRFIASSSNTVSTLLGDESIVHFHSS